MARRGSGPRGAIEQGAKGTALTSRRADLGKAALCALACAIALCAVAVCVSRASGADDAQTPAACALAPSWIAGATLSEERQNALLSCFQSSSSQAEVALSIRNNRPYAQLIIVSGATADLEESSFTGPLEAKLARLLAQARAGQSPPAFLLGPGERATLLIDRPAPGPARVLHVGPAADSAFAVGALAWRFLSAAGAHLPLSQATLRCVLTAVAGALSSPRHPERALGRMHACASVSGLSPAATKLLRGLAASLLIGGPFRQVIHSAGSEPHRGVITMTVASANPYLANPAIRLATTQLPTLSAGVRLVEHLGASGGTPPYRFYIVPEAGGPGVPGWVDLASDGTLTLEPPAGFASSVSLPIEVFDSLGEHSVVSY
jgi:hypothetical protein